MGTVQNEIHVWHVMLDDVNLPWAESILSQDEQTHCGKFHFTSPRAEFVRSRAAVRQVLGDYLECEPSAVRFHKNAFGKLEISDPHIAFSVSHANSVALIAVAPCAVGIDLESIDGTFEWRSVAYRFFTPAEMRYILQAPAEDQIEKFLQCWTRREAFVKARGTGDPTAAPELLSNQIFHSGSTWSIENPSIVSGFMCGVAYEEEPLPLRVHQWHMNPTEEKAAV
jgi:4'-phosphopantetheinyl transferase